MGVRFGGDSQKFLFSSSLGAGRFAKIGIPAAAFTAPFVGVVEIIFDALILVGFWTRISAIPLLTDISVAGNGFGLAINPEGASRPARRR
jgi:uncharacterized membrane protein YphA (DoxX/SURF4 family)